MNQQTIFDEAFEKQTFSRRRDMMPTWLTVYMWCIIVFSTIFFIWITFFAPAYPGAEKPQTTVVYLISILIWKFIPTALFSLMGILVWLEAKWAIRYNLCFALIWALLIVCNTIFIGPEGLLIGILMPLFIPYWIGLFPIRRKWEKRQVSGKNPR